jgi:hypothetical protein
MRSVSLATTAAVGAIAGVLVVIVPVVGCSSSRNSAGPRAALFSYTCCRAGDVDRSYLPGQTINIHWIVTSTSRTSQHETHPVELSAKLGGPFADVAAAKTAADDSAVVSATPIKTSEKTGGAPVSRITLPRGMQPGYYNLTTTVDYGGHIASGTGIIHVAAQ